ncbi:MAG: hypothetical protein H0X66_19480 [Verrucomicrobia bacterium]|nr:hypothetical protein [Verrucomicrobiota bacterium]
MNHGRFTECCFLRSIGRPVLTEFFQRFEPEFAARNLTLPAAEVSDELFFAELGRLLMSPEGLPDRVNEVLHEIQELSTQEGHERLRAAIGRQGMQLPLGENATPEEVALRVWLHSPELLVKQYSEHRFSRLNAFVHCERDTDCLPLQRNAEKQANEAVLVAHLDNWFGANDRGKETVLIEKFELNGEEWYVIRHGDTYFRSSRIEKRKVEVVHYRPAKDDLVVYNPQRDELRINAKLKGERELYRAAFGQYLHGFENYFRVRETYCLEPLRELGVESLACGDIPGIRKVALTELEMIYPKRRNFATRWRGEDVFEDNALPGGMHLPIPAQAKLTEAEFQFFVGNSKKPLKVKVCPPNVIRVPNKQWAVQNVQDWLAARGFIRSTDATSAVAA